MTSEEIFDKVNEIIIEQLGVTETSVTMEASFIDDLGADSLDIVELIMALEEKFDTEIPDEDAEKIVTIGDVVEKISGYSSTTVNQNMKGKIPEKDIKTIVSVLENKFPNLAAEIRKL